MDFLKKFFRKNAPKAPETNPNPGQTFILEPILTPSGLGLDGDAGDGTPPLDGDFDIDLNAADGDDIDTPDDISSTLDAEPTDSGEDDSTAGDNPDVSGGEIDDSDIDDSDIEEISYITSLTEDEGLDTPGNQLDTELQGEGQQTLNPEQVEAKDIEPDGEQEPLTALSANRTSGDSSAEGLSQPSDTETTGGDRIDPIDDNPTGEQSLNPPEEEEEIAPTLEIVPPNFTFDSGVFTVGESGEVGVDFLFDGGGYQGELAIFSLEGMDEFEAGSEEFIQEAATRALSNSELGHVVISDAEEGAKFSGNLGERDQNDGEYLGVKTFQMRSGDEFGVMLVPNKTVARVLDNPTIGGSGRPLFSMVTANPDDAFHVGQIADVTGDGNTFVMEDIRVDGKTDSDYNDVIFQVRGAEGKAALLDSAIASDKEWRYSDLGQALLEYAKPYITPESVETEVSDLIQDVQGLTDALQEAVESIEPEVVEPAETPAEPTPTPEPNEQPPELSEPDNSANSEQDVETSDTQETETAENSTAQTTNSEQDVETSDTQDTEIAQTANSEQDVETSATQETKTAENSTAQTANSEQDAETATNSEQEEQTPDTEEPEHIHDEYQEPSATDNLIARLDHLTTRLEDAQNAPVSTEEAEQLQTLVQQVETLTETLEQPDYQSFSERAELAVTRVVERLENVAQRIVPIGETPPEFEFAETAQPLVGIIDSGFSEDNPDIDYARITLGQDHIDNDNNPLLSEGEGNEHGTHILGIIGATENNGIGIDGINDQAPLWVGRAVGSGKWAESLVEFVDAARESGQPNAVVNLSMDLTQIDAEGNVTTRYEFTPLEMAALEYARQNNVLVVAAAGNDADVMSALGQASQQFDNLLTVGAAEKLNGETSVWKGFDRAEYSSYGQGLDLVADTGTLENPVMSTVGDNVGFMGGTSVATAKVTGAASQVWAANPELSYRQVIEIIKSTTTDLNEANPDAETGSGLLNLAAAIHLAQVTKKEELTKDLQFIPLTWSGEGLVTPMERPTNPNSPQNGSVNNTNNPLSSLNLQTFLSLFGGYSSPWWLAFLKQVYNRFHSQSTPTPPILTPIDVPAGRHTYNMKGNSEYRLNLGNKGNLALALRDTNLKSGDFSLELQRVGGGTVRPSTSDPNGNFFDFENLPQGQYVVKVKPNSNQQSQPYNMVLNLDEAGGSLQDSRNLGNLGKQRNTVNDHVGIPYKEEDYYKFSTDSFARPLYFAVRHESGDKNAHLNGNVKFVLFDKYGRTLKEVDSVGRDPIFDAYNLKPNSEYYVKVRALDRDSTNYQLVLNLQDLLPFVFNVPAGRHTYDTKGHSEYKFELGNKGNVALAFRDTQLKSGDFDFELHRVGGGIVRPTTSDPNGNFFAFDGLPKGKYVGKVKVDPGKEGLSYTTVVNLDEAGGSLQDSRNLGNLGGKRETVNDHVGIPYKEEDYYKFSTDSSARPLFFAVRHESGDKNALLNGNVKFVLFDKNGRTVKEVDSVGRKPILSSLDLQPNSEYYVKVRALHQDSTNYHLVLNLEGKNSNPVNPPPLHSNPTESNPLKGFSHPLKGNGTLTQGWHGSKSHYGLAAYAMDFDYDFGAPVYAMRSGKVVNVIEYFDDNGRDDRSWANKANLVYIEHENGYVSRYLHLKKNSVPVKVGDYVTAGQKIGEQGNSGWSTASHLHVAVHKGLNSVPFEIPGVNPR